MIAFSASKVHPSWVLLILLLVFCGGVRMRLASMPLERDEGEYAYMAQRILDGSPPYQDTYLMKFPGIFLAYAGILTVLGSSDIGIRSGLILLNSASIVVIFWLARRLVMFSEGLRFDSKSPPGLSEIDPHWAGFWAAAIYGIASLSPSLLGFSANAEHFILFPSLLGSLLLLHGVDPRKAVFARGASLSRKALCLLAGLCAGVSALMKQPALAFSVAGFFWIGLLEWTRRRLSGGSSKHLEIGWAWLPYTAGLLLPLVALALWMQAAGVFDSFRFWCFEYARHYGSMWNWKDGVRHFALKFTPFFREYCLVWGIALLGIVVSWKRKSFAAPFMLIWLVAGFIATMPGWIFRPHYFLLILPGLALSAGYGLAFLRHWMFLGAITLFFPVLLQYRLLFRDAPEEVSRQIYAPNAFPEMRALAHDLEIHTLPNEQIGVLGSEPEIFFYANRRSASPYIEMYPLLEPQPFAQQMQRDFMDRWEASPPPYLIHVRIPTSWLAYPNSDVTLLRWIPDFLEKHYRIERSFALQHGGAPPSDSRKIIVYRRKE